RVAVVDWLRSCEFAAQSRQNVRAARCPFGRGMLCGVAMCDQMDPRVGHRIQSFLGEPCVLWRSCIGSNNGLLNSSGYSDVKDHQHLEQATEDKCRADEQYFLDAGKWTRATHRGVR